MNLVIFFPDIDLKESISYTHIYHVYIVQYPLGLTDCNANKTAEMIKMLKAFQRKYVPFKNEEIYILDL